MRSLGAKLGVRDPLWAGGGGCSESPQFPLGLLKGRNLLQGAAALW